jgi:hypothetical protein
MGAHHASWQLHRRYHRDPQARPAEDGGMPVTGAYGGEGHADGIVDLLGL